MPNSARTTREVYNPIAIVKSIRKYNISVFLAIRLFVEVSDINLNNMLLLQIFYGKCLDWICSYSNYVCNNK